MGEVSERLHAFEEERRDHIDFSRAQLWSQIAGSDPIRVALLADREHAVGLLRNDDSFAILARSADGAFRETERGSTPKSPTGLAVSGNTIFISGELSNIITRDRFGSGSAGAIAVSGVRGLRDLAIGPEGVLYVADERDGKWLAIAANENAWMHGEPFEQREYPGKIAPFRIARVGSHVIVDDLLAHALTIVSVDARGFPIPSSAVDIKHDGPIWSFDAKETSAGLVIAAGGVEDRPLDRSGGFFGWIDSYVFLYRVSSGVAKKIGEQNVSELGVVTPKAISLDVDSDDSVSVFATGYGGENAARISWTLSSGSVSRIITVPFAPGSAAIAVISKGSYVAANSLLDSWETISDRGNAHVTSPTRSTHPRSQASRIGEALFFTSLMAPNNFSEGAHSRFTCETCHFEGYVDGRTHYTGREDIHATTKPLRGLVNNRPHFSRALDPDLATVSVNEFRVASAGNGVSEWFVVNPADFPWLHELGVEAESLSAEDLRRDLISFLMDFSHSENPTDALGNFSPHEQHGAEVFRDRCESCHEARLAADDPQSRVPFAAWARLIFLERGAIVWGRNTYEKTGVVPYVHELGARVPSLRRLEKKRPYFTNGTAPDLASVLARARYRGADFFHDGASADAAGLAPSEQTDVIEFLKLL